jgi:NAD(P)-dependent dehydrogenase (short-subunit alcohol dehydrogenase family)
VYAGTRGPWRHSDLRVRPLTLDVTNAIHIQHAVSPIGSLDVLVNNAGILIHDDLSKTDVIKQHLAVNLFGPLNVTRAVLPLLKRSKGAIVNILSTSAIAAHQGRYCLMLLERKAPRKRVPIAVPSDAHLDAQFEFRSWSADQRLHQNTHAEVQCA